MSLEMLNRKILQTNNRFSFIKDKKGVAAVEFALIVPILLLLFIGTLEISLAVSVDRKVSRVSSSVADLITQGTSFTRASLDDVTDIAERIMTPYDETQIQISIVHVEIDDNGIARVDWSYGRNGGAQPAKGSLFEIPNSIKTENTHLISATVGVDHQPAFSFIGFDGSQITFDDAAIELSEQMFLRPRRSEDVKCNDC